MSEPNQNSCAMITPPGRGAVAVIATFGPNVEAMIQPLFKSASKANLLKANNRTLFYGVWKPTQEDVVLVRTGNGGIEIHCHGGETAPASILASLISSGMTEVNPEEAIRAGLPGNTGSSPCEFARWKTENTLALTNALTERTAKLLLNQTSILGAQLESFKQLLINDLPAAFEKIEEVISWKSFGTHLTKPWSIVFCGNPNVGKSSLVNTIVGFDRAIVHEKAGTTRDVVTQLTAVNGWPVEIKDTAGIRVPGNPIEEKGIELSRDEIGKADLVVQVLDASESPQASEAQLNLQDCNSIVVINKIDLDTDGQAATNGAVLTSATKKMGIENLISAISNRIVSEIPDPDVLIPVDANQATRLEDCLAAAKAGDIESAIAKLS